jgi:hypothetical protein
VDDSAQNRAGTGQDPNTGRFVPGNRANPGGRPKGLAALIRAKSKDGSGEELVDFLFSVMRGQVKAGEDGEQKAEVPPLRERRAAAEWLGDHLWGKASQTLKLDEGDSPDLVDMPDDQLISVLERQLSALKAKAQSAPEAK